MSAVACFMIYCTQTAKNIIKHNIRTFIRILLYICTLKWIIRGFSAVLNIKSKGNKQKGRYECRNINGFYFPFEFHEKFATFVFFQLDTASFLFYTL